ncbi:MAG: 2-C-methyl-D-erythritol 4-phosphate cytidylyltransferase [Verrucomicrobiia bacterium]
MSGGADCAAVLLAGGSGSRLGFDKILTPLLGKAVICYALEALAESPEVGRMVVVGRADSLEALQTVVRETVPGREVRVVMGGAERQDSVWNGLEACGGEFPFTLIHDGARPLVTASGVANLVAIARECGSAVAGARCTDTLKECGPDGQVVGTPDRARMWQVQTPQVFRTEWVVAGYRQVREAGLVVTDDAAAVERAGYPVRVVEWKGPNLKITRPEDWVAVEHVLRAREGFSVRGLLHQFANDLAPVVGYLPLLKKYRDQPGKFDGFWEAADAGTRHLRERLAAAQETVRRLFPEDSGKSRPGT